MIRLLLASTGLLLLGSIGAFFLFVPLLSIVAVVCILLGLMLMFGLGVQVGTQGESSFGSVRRRNVVDYRSAAAGESKEWKEAQS